MDRSCARVSRPRTLPGNSATEAGGGIYNTGTATVSNSSTLCGNLAPDSFGADVFNDGVLYEGISSKICILDGIPAVLI